MDPSVIFASLTFFAVFCVMLGVVYLLGAGERQRKRDIGRRLRGLEMAAERSPQDESINLRRQELEGSLPFFDRLFRDIGLLSGVRRLLIQSHIEWTPVDLLLRCAAVGVVGVALAYWRTRVWTFAFLFGAAVAFIPVMYVFHRRTRRLQNFERQLPQALDLISRALRAGHGLVAGLEMVAREIPDPVGHEFEVCFEEQNYGLELRDALTNLSERAPVPDMNMVATAILIQRETGGNLAEVLENTAKVIRERYRLKRQIRVHTAQGRLTGMILALLPVFFGVALFMINPEFIATLWRDERGVRLLWIAALLTLVGGLLIRKIVQVRV